MNGWQAVCRQLEALKVDTVFGIPGTQNAELFSEMHCSKIRTITSIHEMASAFAAIGSALSTGKTAVLLTISGPGFCYTIPALVEARHDSVPLLHIVVRNRVHPNRKWQLQDIDHVTIARAVAKNVIEVADASDLVDALCRAFGDCSQGEPGPVVLIIDSSTLNEQQPRSALRTNFEATTEADDGQVSEVWEAVRDQQVLVLAGGGAQNAANEVQSLVHRMNWSVITTTSGRGTVPENDEHVLRIDQCSAGSVNDVIAAYDVVLALGVKFSHNGAIGFGLDIPADKLIHVDRSDEVLNASYPARIAVRMDVLRFCSGLLGIAELQRNHVYARENQRSLLESGRPAPALEPVFDERGEYPASDFFARLQREVPDDAIFVSDSGLHQMLLRRYLMVSGPRQLILPSNFQCMSFGLPAAIGCSIAHPDRLVVCIHGDGGLQMCAAELLTAAKLRLRLVIIVFDDRSFGLIRKQQLNSGMVEAGVELNAPDYAALAAAAGIEYVDTAKGWRETFSRIMDLDRPLLVRQFVMDSQAAREHYARRKLKGRIRGLLGESVVRAVKSLRTKK